MCPLAYEYYVNYGGWFLHAVRDMGWRYVVFVPLKNLILWTLSMVWMLLPETYDLSHSAPMQFAVVVFAVLIWSTLVPGWIRRRHEVWAIYLLLYLAITLVWPWPGTRVHRARIASDPVGDVGGLSERAPIGSDECVMAMIAGVMVVVSAVAGGYVRLTNGIRQTVPSPLRMDPQQHRAW